MNFTASPRPLMLREVLSNFPTGVTAVAAMVGNEPAGMAVSSFTSVSLEPPMVLVCMSRSSTTWPLLSSAPALGVSVLSATQSRACRQLSERRPRRFDGIEWFSSPDGAVFLSGASAWLECSLEQQWPAGDHDIVVMRVQNAWDDQPLAPLVFHGHRLCCLG